MFANAYLHPLVAALDASGVGADLYGHHAPVVCYAADLLLLATNAKYLGTMLELVSDFAQRWRLDFVHPEPDRTKSHCFIFGRELLAEEPRWSLSDQRLSNRHQSEHLGVVLDEGLSAAPHVRHRTARARASLYGLAPVACWLPASAQPINASSGRRWFSHLSHMAACPPRLTQPTHRN